RDHRDAGRLVARRDRRGGNRLVRGQHRSARALLPAAAGIGASRPRRGQRGGGDGRRVASSADADVNTPASVIHELMSSAGVTSKARLSAATPSGPIRRPARSVTSAGSRCSMTIDAPSAVSGSTVESGAATWNGTPWWRARTASPYVPILLATS